ncbi:MAG: 16S rRNA (adenine1518-N6/adenine1519-N6)-dimethyltransferase [Gammaproteobacteria bacterium]|jgi:16S rRNA (adenine1518-N6/adenine1519-N6)-dimethyltransferase
MKHRPRKRFGQNFLQDEVYQQRIASSIQVKTGDKLIEIGPGQGAITAHLLRSHGSLTAIEMDRDLTASLQAKFGDEGLDVIEGDALKVDFVALAGEGKLSVIGNLPYNISTPLIFHLLASLKHINQMVFMLQKEVVDRMVAPPGDKTYGRLSIMAGLHLDAERLFNVPPGAFFPQPKVTSSVVRLTPNGREIDAHTQQRLAQIVGSAFGQRRKTLRNAIKGLVSEEQILSVGLDPKKRPENLSVEDFLSLASCV